MPRPVPLKRLISGAIPLILTISIIGLVVVLQLRPTRFFLLQAFNRARHLSAKIPEYEKFIERYPDYAPPRIKLAGYYTELTPSEDEPGIDLLDKAIDHLMTALRQDPDNIEALEKLGDIYLDTVKEDAGNAERIYRQLVSLAPRDPKYRARLASLYNASDRTDEALKEIEAALALEADSGDFLMIQAEIFRNLDNPAGAIYSCKKAILSFRNEKNALKEILARYTLGKLYFDNRLLFEAAQQYETIIKLYPGAIEAYLELGKTYYALGMLDKTISTLTSSFLDPESWDPTFHGRDRIPRNYMIYIHSVLGRTYLKKGDHASALKSFRKTEELGVAYKPAFMAALKKLSEIPWERVRARYEAGESVKGKVDLVTDHGAYVLLERGGAGFIEMSDVSWTDRLPHPEEVFQEGAEHEFVILDINPRIKQISLGLKQPGEDIWRGAEERYHPGRRLTGAVSRVTDYGVFVELEPGMEGLLRTSEFSWDTAALHPEELFRKGQEIEVMVLSVSEDDRRIELGAKQLDDDPWENIREYYEKGRMVKGTVEAVTDHTATVGLETGIKGLIRASDISWSGKPANPRDTLTPGQAVEAVVLEINERDRRISLGIKQLTPDPWKGIENRYPPGEIVTRRVTELSTHGALIQLEEGVEGMIRTADISWEAISHPAAVLKPGETVRAVVISSDGQKREVTLGIKQLTPDPWKNIKELYHAGKKMEVTVVRMDDNSIHVELEENLLGVIYKPDISWTRRINHPSEIFAPGQTLEAVILRVDTRNRTIVLGIKQLEPDPWDAIKQKYPRGKIVSAEITEISPAGIWARLEDDLEGFLPLSGTELKTIDRIKESYAVGDSIRVEISNVDNINKRINFLRERPGE